MSTKTPTEATGAREERVPVGDGTALAVDVWAGGSPSFVLVHGLASNAKMWHGVAADLAGRGHAVAAVDQRGHGRSDKPDTGYDLDTAVADLAAVMAWLATDSGSFMSPVLAGQSWGANVVLELAWANPDDVTGVVCVDGGMHDLAEHFPEFERCAEVLAPPRLAGLSSAQIEGAVRRMHADWPESGVAGTLANFEFRPDGTAAPWLTFDRHMMLLRALWEHHPSGRYPEMKVPVLLVPADDGSRSAERMARVEKAATAIPRAEVHWFSPAHHDIHAQFPERLAALMHDAATSGMMAGGPD